jgi:hypothetical protein
LNHREKLFVIVVRQEYFLRDVLLMLYVDREKL